MTNNIRRWFAPLAGVIVLIAASPQAKATLLPPGGTVSPVPATGGVITVLADTGPEAWAIGATDAGTIREIVGTDTGNPFGVGKFTFLIQVSVTKGNVSKVNDSSFTNFMTDVGQNGAAFPPFFVAGTVMTTSADRSVSGATVGFNFVPTGVTAGNTSFILAIRTDASAFRDGVLGIIDSGGTSAPGFAPGPEPGSLVLLTTCFAGLGGAYAWRRRKGLLTSG